MSFFQEPLRKHRALLLAFAGGAVYALAEPPFDLYPSIVFGLAVLAFVQGEAKSPRQAFARALAWALAMQLLTLRPLAGVVQNFTPLGPILAWACLPLLAALQSLPWGGAFALAHLLRERWLVPNLAAFAVGVFLSLLAPAVFLWTPAGLLSPWPVFLQLADIVGEHGVSVLLALVSGLIAEAYRERRPALLGASAAILASMAIHGAWRMHAIAKSEDNLPKARVALLEPSIGAHERWQKANWPRIVASLRDLTYRAEEAGAELTVWPEASYPYLLPHREGETPRSAQAIIGGKVRGPVLVGALTQRPDGDRYNSATVVSVDGRMQSPQAKIDLLWFGEAVPFGDIFPWLRRAFQPRGALVPGDSMQLLRSGEARMGVLNCYEDSLTARGRKLMDLEPNLLVNVTNDAWFVPSAVPELHLRLSIMRTIELRRDLVRSVNMGPSSWIDASGRVRARFDGEGPGFLMTTPSLRDSPKTIYARFGYLPTIASLAIASLAGALRRKQPKVMARA